MTTTPTWSTDPRAAGWLLQAIAEWDALGFDPRYSDGLAWVRNRAAELAAQAGPLPPAQDYADHVAWMHFIVRNGEQFYGLCNQGDDGAFRVYRHPAPPPAQSLQDWHFETQYVVGETVGINIMCHDKVIAHMQASGMASEYKAINDICHAHNVARHTPAPDATASLLAAGLECYQALNDCFNGGLFTEETKFALYLRASNARAAYTAALANEQPMAVGEGGDQQTSAVVQDVAYMRARIADLERQLQEPAELRASAERSDSDRRDAERYRWLRHGDNDEGVLRSFKDGRGSYILRNEELDAAIDAAIAQ